MKVQYFDSEKYQKTEETVPEGLKFKKSDNY